MAKHSIEKNSLHLVRVTDMTDLGAGVARIDGIVVFVQGGVDGDEAEIKIIKAASDYCVARIERLLTPSPYRQESGCVVSRRCGGCAYQSITYAHELELKRRQVESSFRKEGLSVPVNDVLSTGEWSGWRNKVQLPIGADGRIGYYAAHSHEIIPCLTCPLQLRRFDRIIAAAQEWILAHPSPLYRHLCLRGGSSGVMVCLVARKEFAAVQDFADTLAARFPEIVSIQLNINPHDTNVIWGEQFRLLYGQSDLEDELLGLRFRIAAPAFYQVNRAAAELAYRKLGELADIRPGERVVDLYCGTGTIGLCLTASAGASHLLGVEIVPEAVENARQNALRNGITNAEFLCGDAGIISPGEADVVLVDPPRKGLSPQLIDTLARLSPDRIAYMSCDHRTLARDCRLLIEKGYLPGPVTPVDLFPRTGHVETVVLLSRETNPLTVEVKMEVETGEVKEHPTYKRIQEYVQDKYGFKVHTAYIAEVKRMVGLDMHKAPNAVEQRKHEYHPCPPEKVEAIKDALRHFGLISE